MDAQLDTVIQDLQGAIPLAAPAAWLTTEAEAWRAHARRFAKTDVTAEPKHAIALRGVEGDEIDDLDSMLQRLEP